MVARTVSAFALALCVSCASTPSARHPTFQSTAPAQSSQGEAHHTKVTPLAAVGLAALGAAVAAFAGVVFFVVPQRSG
jgi:hypothetical protein